MSEMTVKLKWDKSHGPTWMNPDNLAILLYTAQATRKDLLSFEVLETDYEKEEMN